MFYVKATHIRLKENGVLLKSFSDVYAVLFFFHLMQRERRPTGTKRLVTAI